MSPDPFACAETGCHFLEAGTLEGCIKRACPFAHQRLREESRVKDDAARRAEGPRAVDSATFVAHLSDAKHRKINEYGGVGNLSARRFHNRAGSSAGYLLMVRPENS